MFVLSRCDFSSFNHVKSDFTDIKLCNHGHKLACFDSVAVYKVVYLHLSKLRGTA